MCLDGPNFGQIGWFADRGRCDSPPRMSPVRATSGADVVQLKVTVDAVTGEPLFEPVGCASCREGRHDACEALGVPMEFCPCCRPF
jgi:hypothetical protein